MTRGRQATRRIVLDDLATGVRGPAESETQVCVYGLKSLQLPPETPPNSQNPLLETGAVAIVVAISAKVATAPPCILPMGLQSPGPTSSSKTVEAWVACFWPFVRLADTTLMFLISKASNPYRKNLNISIR